jgi:hypothetical protein
LDYFIEQYLQSIQPYLRLGIDTVLERLRRYLEENKYDNFKSGEDFAERVVEKLAQSWKSNWSTNKVVSSIRKTTKSIYEFFRITDTTPFKDESPIKLKFGGQDLVSIEFFSEIDNWYFSKFGGNTDKSLRIFLQKEYLEKGAALFGRESSESLDDFRKAAGEKFQNLTDQQIYGIVFGSVSRIRSWAYIGSLDQAGITLAEYVATLDEKTTDICIGIDGKRIDIGVAQKAIERLTKLEAGEFAKHLYESNAAKEFRKNPADWLKKEIDENGVVSEQLTANGLAIPPLHVRCRTYLRGLTAGIDYEVN